MAPSNPFSSYFRSHSKRNTSNHSSPDGGPYTNNLPSLSNFRPELSQPSRNNSDGKSPQTEFPTVKRPPLLPPIPRIAPTHAEPNNTTPESIPPTPPPKSPGRDWGTKLANKVEHWKDGARENTAPFPGAGMHANSIKPTQDVQGFSTSTHETVGLDPSGLAAHGSQAYLMNEFSSNSLYPPSSVSPISLSGEHTSTRSPSTEGSHAPKSARGRLNLLNPMGLFMRRRSHQTVETSNNDTASRSPFVPAMTLPEDYDPRIRGNKVHDFSAPRKRATPPVDNSFSFGGHTRNDTPECQRDSADSSPSKLDHTPIFKENFDDDFGPQEMDRALRAEQLANQSFLKRASLQPPSPPDKVPPTIPSETAPSIASRRSVCPPSNLKLDTNKDLPPLSPVRETDDVSEDPPKQGSSPKSPKSPPITRSRAASGADPYFQTAGIPQHTTSKASRFSFQILGNDSAAQEKLLEERHKEKAAAKALAERPSQPDEFAEDDYDEDAMYEEMMNEDGFDEEIPGMQDDDELGYGGFSGYGGLANADLSTFGTQQPIVSMPAAMNNGQGFPYHSESKLSKDAGVILDLQIPALGETETINDTKSIDSDTCVDLPINEGIHEAIGTSRGDFRMSFSSHGLEKLQNKVQRESDDLYFDDGMIDDPVDQDGEGFDESVFDDPTNPLYERPGRKYKPSNGPEPSLDNDLGEEMPTLAPKSSVRRDFKVDGYKDIPITDPSADLDNLNAYHEALAEAANQAAASGRFNRHSILELTHEAHSLSPSHSQSDGTSSSRPSLIPDDGRFSTSTVAPFSPTAMGSGVGFPVEDDYGYDDFDGGLEDDPMIAEANAEALACNFEEDYGQEFGFYASSSGQGDAVFSNGGYFGPRDQMIGRSTSGRNAVQEPNLTPITERSEYSTRNSFISITNQYPWHGQGPQALTSPGLAQLARMSPIAFPEDDSDISLEQLRKLRRGAFGDSSMSLKSPGSSPRNSLPSDANVPKHGSSGLVSGMNFVQWDLESLSVQGTSDSASQFGPDSSHLDDPTLEEDPEALDAVNFPNGSDSDFEPDDDNHNSFHGSYLDDIDAEDNESPTIRDFHPDIHTTPLSSQSAAPLSPQLSIPSASTPCTLDLSPPTSPTAPLPSLLSPLAPMSPFAIAPPWAHCTPQQQGSVASSTVTMSPSGPPPNASWKTHSRKSSAADSVTYVRERDEQGEQRWVIERRRTASTGEMELVGREIVEGGRI